MVSEYLSKVTSVAVYSLAGILGIVGANYATLLPGGGLGPIESILLGAVVFAIPVFAIRGNDKWQGPLRMFFGVLGLTLVLRAILGSGTGGKSLLNITLPAQFAAVF